MIQYLSSGSAQRTLLGLHAMFELKELCDVTLETEDGLSINVHRNVLAAASPYFRAMFTGQLLESSKSVIKLKDLEGESLQDIVEFMYTSSITINDDNVESLLNAASVFQVIEIVNVCCEFLKEQLHPSNCLGIAAVADRFSCEELLDEANKFTVKNFNQIVKFEEFKNLTLDEVKNLLLDENITVRSEEDVFEAALDWLSVTSDLRCVYLAEVLSCVRLPVLSPEYLTSNVINNELLQGNEECQLMIKEAVEYALSPSSEKRKQGCITRMQPRIPTGFADVLVAIGGLFSGEAVSSTERYSLYTDEWFGFPAMNTSRYGFAVTNVRGHIYCLGGYHNGQFLNTVEAYNPEDDSWSLQKPMFTERKYFGAACLCGKVYAVGGSNGQERLKTVECYDPFLDKWIFTAPMLTPRMYHGVVALGGLLYAVGGHNGANRLGSMECYDPQTDVWTTVSSMSKCNITF
jgi:hypothetical protein